MSAGVAERKSGACGRIGGSLDRSQRLAVERVSVLTARRMRHRPRAQRPLRRRRGGPARVRPAALATLVILAGLLFGQLVQLSDLLLFPHYACEHGELAHAHAHAGNAEPAAALPSHDSAPRATAAPGEGEHEHCTATAIRHRELIVTLHVPEATILGWIADPPLVLGSPRRPIALLAVAPKASPPRA
jgi:hypothetical protein